LRHLPEVLRRSCGRGGADRRLTRLRCPRRGCWRCTRRWCGRLRSGHDEGPELLPTLAVHLALGADAEISGHDGETSDDCECS
jgi:hypothetical protein